MVEVNPAGSPGPRTSGFHVPTWVATVVGGLILFGIAFAIGRRSGNHGDGRGGFGNHGGGRGIGFIVLLLLIAVLITGVVLVVRHFASRPQAAGGAENVLAERFARGEIDEAEYQRRRSALRA